MTELHSRTSQKNAVLSFARNSAAFFSYFGKSLWDKDAAGAVMSWLRNASFLLAEFVRLLGDSGAATIINRGLPGKNGPAASGCDTLPRCQ